MQPPRCVASPSTARFPSSSLTRGSEKRPLPLCGLPRARRALERRSGASNWPLERHVAAVADGVQVGTLRGELLEPTRRGRDESACGRYVDLLERPQPDVVDLDQAPGTARDDDRQ